MADNFLNSVKKRFAEVTSREVISLEQYLERCKTDPSVYANVYQRLLTAIGEPVVVDTKNDSRLSRIFNNRVIRRYPAFDEFYGIEDVIDRIVSFCKHAAQGLEEHKQILYLLGPVGSSKSSLAEKLKSLIQQVPVYVLADEKGNLSPVFDNPLNVFKYIDQAAQVCEHYNIPAHTIQSIPSPWAIERLKEYDGDVTKFKVVKIYPNALNQECVMKVEPGDENNQDISALVGKIDIRKLEEYPQNHPDAYSFSGGLCRGNRGIMEFVEMFKAPIKMLHPLLTATQEKNFNGTEAIPAMPFEGIILAHSNESEWAAFKNDKKHEAFIDRIVIIKVPYCLRVTEETNIYGKLLNSSSLSKAPCAPGTLDLLAQFSVMTRLIEPQNSNVYSKMRVYDGQNIRDTDPKAKPIQEYRDAAGINEGMEGISTRFAFKVLSKVFNFDKEEVAANPVHLMYVLENSIIAEQFDKERQDRYLGYLKGVLTDKYLEFVEKDIRKAFLESYGGLCQDTFNSYFHWADYWIRDEDYRDESTNVMLDRAELNAELEKIEKPAGISNPKEFRSEITNFVLRYKADHGGDFPSWTSYEKMRAVIEKKVLAATDELLPVISFAPKRSEEDQRKHAQFVETMVARGYTERQVRIIADWWQRMKKSS